MLFSGNEKKPRIYVRKAFTRNPVFIDGLARVGKMLINMAVSSLERAEHAQGRPMLDSIFVLHGMGLMDRDVAVDLLKREVDMYLYFYYLGRHLNTNLHDWSGVWQSRDPEIYLRRMMEKDNADNFLKIMKRIKKENPIVPLHTHEMLCDYDIFLKSFVNSRIIAAFRHPVDVVFSWHRKKWGTRYGVDPRSIHHTVRGVKGPVPWFAFDWAEEYEALPPIDRVIRSVCRLNSMYYNQVDNAPPKYRERILSVCFERFVTEPDSGIREIADFLDTVPSAATQSMLLKQRVPREAEPEEFKTKYLAIKEQASKGAFALLMENAEIYEKRFIPCLSVNDLK
jgi:hypothetical protein